jgi:hypothetical protein
MLIYAKIDNRLDLVLMTKVEKGSSFLYKKIDFRIRARKD